MSKTVTDQMGQQVTAPDQPKRIVSVVPSQTELLFDLGLHDRIVGLTRFCIHPDDQVHTRERIGGTKDFDIARIKALEPDLIIGNKEENYEEGIAALREFCPVWMSDIATLDDAYQMMLTIGEITNSQSQASAIVNEIQSGFSTLSIVNYPLSIKTAVYFIWRKPYMVAAQDTFIDHMLDVFGVKNIFADKDRYPAISATEISAANPELIFLSSEPYAFSEKHIGEFQQLCPDAQIHIVDGEMFSWYGSRLRHTPSYFLELRNKLLH